MERGPQPRPGDFEDFGLSSMVRHWRMLQLICQHPTGMTVQDLALQFAISQRSIQRDLKILQNMGFPLESRNGPHGRKYWRCSNLNTQHFPAAFGELSE